jgi:hypothetical protein
MLGLTVMSTGTGICDDASVAPGGEVSDLKRRQEVCLTHGQCLHLR